MHAMKFLHLHSWGREFLSMFISARGISYPNAHSSVLQSALLNKSTTADLSPLFFFPETTCCKGQGSFSCLLLLSWNSLILLTSWWAKVWANDAVDEDTCRYIFR